MVYQTNPDLDIRCFWNVDFSNFSSYDAEFSEKFLLATFLL